MEAVASIICAVAGLFLLLSFLWDFGIMASSGGLNKKGAFKAGLKLILTLLALHFHFELDILD